MNLCDEKLEKLFIEKTIMKINNDFRGDSAAKKSAVKFLHDCFGDSIDDYNFIPWLYEKMNCKPIQLFNLLKCEIMFVHVIFTRKYISFGFIQKRQ